jgi:hypothetical protein
MPTRLVTASLLVSALALSACWNDSYNQDTSTAGGRFQLSIEPSRTDIDGTHFLVDSATGALWHLVNRGGRIDWVRIADAPEDAAVLEPEPVPLPAED